MVARKLVKKYIWFAHTDRRKTQRKIETKMERGNGKVYYGEGKMVS